MTRRVTDGAELGNLNLTSGNGGHGYSPSTEAKRSGSYSYKLTQGPYSSPGYIFYNIPEAGEVFVRFAYDFASHLSCDVADPLTIYKDSTNIASVSTNGVDKMTLKVGGSVVATGTIPITTGRFYLFEVHLKVGNSPNGVFQLKVDGVIDIDYTGDTQPGADTTVNKVYCYHNYFPGGTSTYTSYVDDIAINDTAGTVDNSWCGDGHVIYLAPNAAGDATELTPNTGNNYAAVDEVPSDSDTTYVEGGTVDTRDLYNLAASGLAAGSVITRVIPMAQGKDTVANGGKIKMGVKTNGTEYFGDDLTLTTNYTLAVGTDHTTNPNTGEAWTITELDALQIGVKVRGT